MDISGKVWGTTSKLFAKNNVEICRIQGKATGRSSTHKHTFKWSKFFVERGRLRVVVEKNDYKLTDETILAQFQSMVIAPGEYHRFEILDPDTVAYEIYWVELDAADIIRRDCGSISS